MPRAVFPDFRITSATRWLRVTELYFVAHPREHTVAIRRVSPHGGVIFHSRDVYLSIRRRLGSGIVGCYGPAIDVASVGRRAPGFETTTKQEWNLRWPEDG